VEILFFKYKHFSQTIIDMNVVAISIVVSLIVYFIDLPRLKKEGLVKDAKIAKSIFIIYLVVPPVIYVVLKFI